MSPYEQAVQAMDKAWSEWLHTDISGSPTPHLLDAAISAIIDGLPKGSDQTVKIGAAYVRIDSLWAALKESR